jgi:hypothetical protein
MCLILHISVSHGLCKKLGRGCYCVICVIDCMHVKPFNPRTCSVNPGCLLSSAVPQVLPVVCSPASSYCRLQTVSLGFSDCASCRVLWLPAISFWCTVILLKWCLGLYWQPAGNWTFGRRWTVMPSMTWENEAVKCWLESVEAICCTSRYLYQVPRLQPQYMRLSANSVRWDCWWNMWLRKSLPDMYGCRFLCQNKF